MHADRDIPAELRGTLKAAQLYYIQDMTMDAIARELGTSRSTVSRMIGKAKENGLVDIQIRFPSDQAERMQHLIRSRYGVTSHVVPVPNLADETERLERVAMTAGRVLSGIFDSNMSLGIAWGVTIEALSRHLQPKETNHSKIVQLNGSGGMQKGGVEYPSIILQRFAEAFGAMTHAFHVPQFFDDPAVRNAMWKERSVRRHIQLQSHVDVALFGLGAPQTGSPDRVHRTEFVSDEDYATLAQAGVVGDIATVFFRADGTDDNIPINSRSTGLPLKQLRKVPRRVCVVSGRAKLLGLRGALEGGLITDLVIDEPTARWIANAISPRGG